MVYSFREKSLKYRQFRSSKSPKKKKKIKLQNDATKENFVFEKHDFYV